MDVWQQPYNFPSQSWRAMCAAAALLAFAIPSAVSFSMAVVIRNTSRLLRMPFIWDSDQWAFFCDAAFLVGLLGAARRRWSGHVAVLAASPIVRKMFAILYFASGFWKINSSFLSPRTSCASIFTASILGQIWPHAWGLVPEALARFVVHMGPAMVIIGECMAGLLVGAPWRSCRLAGFGLVLLFHAGIAFTPSPNGIANFSYKAASRYCFLFPEAVSKAFLEAVSLPTSSAGYAGRASASLVMAVAWHVGKVAGPQHMGAVFFTSQAVLYARAAQLEFSRVPTQKAFPLGVAGWWLVIVVAFLAFGAQILGLTDLGALASPFSSIRMQGGSNHLLVPTGLLQAWAGDGSMPGSSFGGGVVRVEYTDSVWLNSLYPSESTATLPPEAVAILHRGGHLGRQFNPTVRRVVGPGIRAFMPRWKLQDGPFLQYTVPAMELRRLAFEARATGEAFHLVYTRLPGVAGDEVWRRTAKGLRVEFSLSRNGTEHCIADGQPCSAEELVLLPELDWMPKRTRLFFPYPVIAGADNELPCMD
mmetsp:Transcript_41572/g.114521  ORF Transcript_41572/g.114521 Transcript_41572/m.114521 type:complete len:533 (+) Transcript_41572:162-1760(+)